MRLILLLSFAVISCAEKPHIVWIVADDLGWNDVGFTGSGSNVHSPVLDGLARSGAVLANYYVSPICTPTRNCFMSGRYPIHTGLQHSVIKDSVPNALPINETIIASIMKQGGYSTHIVSFVPDCLMIVDTVFPRMECHDVIRFVGTLAWRSIFQPSPGTASTFVQRYEATLAFRLLVHNM